MEIITRITGKDLVDDAHNHVLLGTPYEKLDCQALVEKILEDAGVRKPDGTKYNWKGSNSMFRNHIRWRGTIAECRKKFGDIPMGAFVFIVKNDGGEKERGYNDSLGNASHVGLYLGAGKVIDSQPTGGVRIRDLSIFTHVGLMSMIDYTTTTPESPDKEALAAIHTLRDAHSTDAEYLAALTTLSTYLYKED